MLDHYLILRDIGSKKVDVVIFNYSINSSIKMSMN